MSLLEIWTRIVNEIDELPVFACRDDLPKIEAALRERAELKADLAEVRFLMRPYRLADSPVREWLRKTK